MFTPPGGGGSRKRLLFLSVYHLSLLAAAQERMSEQEGGTLLSSITVLSDSIHIGSMSPSSTIHLGPAWETLACSLISEENKPGTAIQGDKEVRLREKTVHNSSDLVPAVNP